MLVPRAGLNRFRIHDHISVMAPGDSEPGPISIASVAYNLDGYQGLARVVKMLDHAWQDLLDNTCRQRPGSDALVLMALPDPIEREFDFDYATDVQDAVDLDDTNSHRAIRRQTYCDLITSRLYDALWKKHQLDLKPLALQVVFGDRVAFARILEKAGALLDQGHITECYLMVHDSLIGDSMLDTLWQQGQLKTADNPVGFIPGEGAAVIWLTKAGRHKSAFKTQLSVTMDRSSFAAYSPVNNEALLSDEERVSWHGHKMLKILAPLLGDIKKQTSPRQLLIDINGQENRACEFGNLQVLLKKDNPRAQHLEPIIPALGFGETGAMAGAYAFACILASAHRVYAKSRNFIILLSERDGRRAAARLLF